MSSSPRLDKCLRHVSTVLDRHTTPFRVVSSLSVQCLGEGHES